jgi:hypothetical protein
MIGLAEKPLLTEVQFIQLCRYLLKFHYGIIAVHFCSLLFYVFIYFNESYSSNASMYLLLALSYSLLNTYIRFRFFSRDGYIGAGTKGEVGLSLPAKTNYIFWTLWCAFELMLALIALIFCAKAALGAE